MTIGRFKSLRQPRPKPVTTVTVPRCLMKGSTNIKKSMQISKKQQIVEEDSGAESEVEEESLKNDGTILVNTVQKNDVEVEAEGPPPQNVEL